MTHSILRKLGKEEPQRRALVVAGMHRSGTSALAGTLHELGAALPRHVLHGNVNNPRGYFESRVLYPLHDQLLADSGSAWDQVSGPSDDWFASEAADLWVDRLVAVAKNEFPDAELLVFKDPRLCRLLPIWKRVLRRLDIEAHYLIPVRDPLHVARSLQHASALPRASSLMIWLDYFLRAERDTRDAPRSFVHFDALMSDWRREISRACAQSRVSLRSPDHATELRIEAFLRRDIAHSSRDTTAISFDAHPWIEAAYREALAACAGGVPSSDALDKLRIEFDTAVAALDPAIAATRGRSFEKNDDQQTLVARVSSLEEELDARTHEREELRDRLTQRRGESHALRKTVELMMRWVLDRSRDEDKPAPEELRAALAAIEKAEPAAIPQIASTALLLAEKNLQLAHHERERELRASLVVDAGARVALAERELSQARTDLEQRGLEVDGQSHLLESLREQLRAAEAQLRIERTRSASATAEQERLHRQLAAHLRASGSDWFARMLKGMGL